MAVAVNYWKCSPDLYQKYYAAGKIVDTDFYFVEDKNSKTQELYLGKILLSSADESILAIKEVLNTFEQTIKNLAPVAKSGLIEDLNISWDTMLIFDGGGADVTLAKIDETKLK